MADGSRLPDLEQLIFAGDEAAWSLADWQWDPLALTAAPAEGRVPKRARTGAGAPAACTSLFAAGGAAQGCSACPVPALPAAAGSVEQCGGGEGCNAAAVQEADGACGSGGRGARRGSASLLCRDAAFHVAEQLAEATAPAAEDTAQAARGNAQAPREAGHADNGVMQGQEPGGVSSSAESGPAGAAAPAASAGGGPRCQVESCRRELAGLSAYHQKCRICEVHLKAPCFERAGLPQRFCQRCGRCHELGAFQGAKRSCREQLAKHNARRRRAQDRSGDASAVQFSGAGASMDLLPFPGQPLPDGGQAAALQSLGLGALGLGSLFPDGGGQACVVGVPGAGRQRVGGA